MFAKIPPFAINQHLKPTPIMNQAAVVINDKGRESISHLKLAKPSSNKYTPLTSADNKLIEKYLPLVKSVLRHMLIQLPSYADGEELESIGVLGLIAAVRRFNPEQEKTFEAYAALRIRGAVLDELRRLDKMPRTARTKLKKVEAVIRELEQKFGRPPSSEEIREYMGITVKEFNRMQKQVVPVSFVSLNRSCSNNDDDNLSLQEIIPDQNHIPCYDRMDKQERVKMIMEKMQDLSDRQRKIITMYYFEGLNLSQIAGAFGVSEARICQIHMQCIQKLKNHFKEDPELAN